MAFSGASVAQTLSLVTPNSGLVGTSVSVIVTGQGTHFVQGTTVASFGPGISVGGGPVGDFGPVTVISSTGLTAQLTIDPAALDVSRTVTVKTGGELISLAGGFTVSSLLSISPTSAFAGQTIMVAITGQGTNFAPGAQAKFGPGISVGGGPVGDFGPITVTDSTDAVASIVIDPAAAQGPRTLIVTSGSEQDTLTNGFTVQVGAALTSINPATANAGSNLSVTITGIFTNFAQGITVASFGPGISVGGGPVGDFGPVTVMSPTTATAQLAINASAPDGSTTVVVQTGSEVASLDGGFAIVPTVSGVSPNGGQPGQMVTVTINGLGTNFVQGTTQASFGPGISVGGAAKGTFGPVTVMDPMTATAQLMIDAAAAIGTSTVTVQTGNEVAHLFGGFSVNPPPSPLTVTPASGAPGQTLQVIVIGDSTDFDQMTTASFGAGVAVGGGPQGGFGPISAYSPIGAVASLQIDRSAAAGSRTITVQTSDNTYTLINGFTVASASSVTITDFQPQSGHIGDLITVTGSGFGANPSVTLAKLGGGTISAPVLQSIDTSLSFIIPAGAATGPITVTVGNQSATSASALTIVPSSNFTITAVPSNPTLIQGQLVAVAVQLSSSSGFSSLAQLSLTGLPSGVTASFKPPSITAGQTAVLTLGAPANQPVGSAPFTIAALGNVDGLPVTQSAPAQLTIQAPTTSFIGRTVVSNTLEIPLAGVTVTMLGLDGNGNTTGCSGSTIADAAGNFALLNLAANCVGPQLVGFDGTTATSPPGKYAGVNLVFTLASGQVTASPVLVHLPRIDNVETFLVTQNSSSNQSYSFTTIPGLSVTVYAGTTFTMPDGTQPNPFPLAAVQVPVDRLPDAKPQVPNMIRDFIVAFQPANATASQPVAVYFPNTLNTPPGTDMALMTLDPTHGTMVPYGTGSVSSDGTQIVPDADPSHPGHLYGLVHFDWHGPMPPSPPPIGPGPPCGCPPGATCFCPLHVGGHSVDVSSGVDVLKYTDITVNGPRGSMTIERTLRTLSPNPGPFGIGSGFNYGYQLGTVGVLTLIMPDGNQFPFNVPQGTGFINNVLPTLRGAVLTPGATGHYSLRWKDGTMYQFQFGSTNRVAYLTAIVDANGNTITLNVTGTGQVTQVTDPVGRSLNLAYDSSNRITSTTDFMGRSVQYTYTSAGYLATVTDPNGGVTTYAYDTQNRLSSVRDPRGIMTEQNTFDGTGRITQQVEADGGLYRFAYTLINPLIPTSSVISAVVTDPNGNSSTYRFTPNQLLTDATDSTGQTKSFALDSAHNNLVTGITGTAVCPVCGDPAQGDQSFTLDQNGNMLSSTDALGNTTTYTYEPVFNKVTSITDPLGNTTKLQYDSKGNLTTRTDPNGNATNFAYNAFGQVTQSIDPTGAKTTFTYDTFGNLATVTDPLGNVTTTIYDGISRPIQTIDALGRRTQTAYDPLSRVVLQTNAQNNKTSFVYDGVGNLLSLTDARGNKTTFTYDGLNRLLTRTTPLGPSDSRTYDVNGNLTAFTDRRGQKSTYTYDSLNRLAHETYPDSTVTRSYDANGRLSQVNDSLAGIFTFAYDAAGRLTAAGTPVGEVQYAYDQAGQVKSRQVAGQAAVQYQYDPAGNLQTASTDLASVTQTFDQRNFLKTIARTNGVSSQYNYDPLGRVLSIAHSGPSGVLNNQTYSYDPVGNRSSSTNDLAQALITQAVGSANYDFDNEQTQFGSTNDTFDANGNLASSTTAAGSTSYTWDSRNRLTSVSSPNSQTTKFIYDFAGNLIQQIDTGSSLNLTQSFLLDDLTNVAYVNRSDGDQYSVLAGRAIDDHLAAVHSNGQIEYGLAGAIGSSVATVDQAGSVKGQFLYEPFGQTTSMGSSYPFQFTGRVPASNGLYYYRARFYSPTAARFISEDPISFGMRHTDLYSYVLNDPLTLTDPSGKQFTIGVGNGTASGFPPFSSGTRCVDLLGFLGCMATNFSTAVGLGFLIDCAVCAATRQPLVCGVCAAGIIGATVETAACLKENSRLCPCH